MIYCAFYTPGLYEREAARLRRSLDRLGLPHDIREVADKGSWAANTAQTAGFIRQMLDDHPGPMVYLDVDAVVWSQPTMFDDIFLKSHDLAVHYRRGTELLNGTVWLSNSPPCRAVIDDYEARSAKDNRNEQRHMADAIESARRPSEWDLGLQVANLPAGYCFIRDLMGADLFDGEPVVIEHLQASREVTGSSRLHHRTKRLAEIGG